MKRPLEMLPSPHIVRCYFAREFQPHLPAMELDWDRNAPELIDRVWHFPEQVAIRGPAPRKFGVVIQRHDQDCYQVRLVWNELGMSWAGLRRLQILTSALAPILQSLGTDLWSVLEQPVDGNGRSAWPIPSDRMTA